jgi:multiple sugar transport system substrate-binding protein
MDEHGSQSERKLTRRELLKLGAGAVGFAMAGSRSPAGAASGFDWKRFKGEKLEVLLIRSPRGDLLKNHQKEFEDLTGIAVGFEQMPEQQLRQKQVIEFASRRTTFDVTSISMHVQKRQFGKAKWLVDIRDYLKDPTMTSPDFDWSDFSEAAIAYAKQADGRIDSIPQNLDYWILFWNKEIFQAKGVQFPKTLDEMVEAAKKLHDPSKGIYGFVARGLKNANTPVWTCLLMNWNVDAVDDNGQLHTEGPEAIAAAEMYKTLMRNYAPPGAVGFNWQECQTTFSQGTAAMWIDGIGFAEPLEDKKKSKVAGKVGYGLVPAGPKAQYAPATGTSLGISAFSNKKGPAFFYCQWATNKVNQGRNLASGAGSPARNSILKDPKVLADLKVPREWADTLVQAAKIGHHGLPIIEPVQEFRDIFGIALTNMIGGADPATELRKATAEFRPILEKSEKS